MMEAFAGVTAVLATAGVGQALVASRLVAAFARKRSEEPSAWPPVTVLKPLHGHEQLLEAALETLCLQDYPDFQIVFGVQNAADPAVEVVRRIQVRFPHLDVALVVDPSSHGPNPKVGNLINMVPAARHDVLVIADSDVHARPDYLSQLVAALQQPGTGLVTTLYAGLPVSPATLPSRLGATQITHGFLPGAVLARAMGRQDCLGATMCLQRQVLDRIGGLRALVDHLADDAVLGRRIVALGLHVAFAQTVPLTTVPESRLATLFRHELRWARTIRSLEPVGFAASILQYPLAWGLLTIALAAGAPWSIGLFVAVWILRGRAAIGVDRALTPLWAKEPSARLDEAALAFSCPVWLLPVRDILSIVVMLASYGGRHVMWRGHGLRADTPPSATQMSVTVASTEGIKAR
jgi:ceramide glucosyltransferase